MMVLTRGRQISPIDLIGGFLLSQLALDGRRRIPVPVSGDGPTSTTRTQLLLFVVV